jgi:hypothetical protein
VCVGVLLASCMVPSFVFCQNRLVSISCALAPFRQAFAPSNMSRVGADAGRAECVLCMDAARTTRFQPCQHSVCCGECAQVLLDTTRVCPLCSGRVASVGPLGGSVATFHASSSLRRAQDGRITVEERHSADRADEARRIADQAERERQAALAAERERQAALAAERERQAALVAERERQAALVAERERQAALVAERERQAALVAERERARLVVEREAAAQAQAEAARKRFATAQVGCLVCGPPES